ncbi:uncharacterized protein BO80DRAFT_9304 [Aspergillus ibericus CBS 121593]|uniref:Uncharacterized protein n=1 Tax=Aspergillus ibericus CBS 121593 TaxID=1448316 RepID=A0A395HH96_9EURO|nr:hypothetical protein BO80DRAFT_9304 [Aspergillus ibericus CBS 121593]RAL06338.1 hypothetical protein BO80DRAFT_9304 [Aspergillus ibericus CBS 121593]
MCALRRPMGTRMSNKVSDAIQGRQALSGTVGRSALRPQCCRLPDSPHFHFQCSIARRGKDYWGPWKKKKNSQREQEKKGAWAGLDPTTKMAPSYPRWRLDPPSLFLMVMGASIIQGSTIPATRSPDPREKPTIEEGSRVHSTCHDLRTSYPNRGKGQQSGPARARHGVPSPPGDKPCYPRSLSFMTSSTVAISHRL